MPSGPASSARTPSSKAECVATISSSEARRPARPSRSLCMSLRLPRRRVRFRARGRAARGSVLARARQLRAQDLRLGTRAPARRCAGPRRARAPSRAPPSPRPASGGRRTRARHFRRRTRARSGGRRSDPGDRPGRRAPRPAPPPTRPVAPPPPPGPFPPCALRPPRPRARCAGAPRPRGARRRDRRGGRRGPAALPLPPAPATPARPSPRSARGSSRCAPGGGPRPA